jgi:hypothetical protein
MLEVVTAADVKFAGLTDMLEVHGCSQEQEPQHVLVHVCWHMVLMLKLCQPCQGPGPAATHSGFMLSMAWHLYVTLLSAGSIMRHFGTARDALKDGPFGCKTRAGQESAAECLEAYPGSEIGRWQLQQREEVYARYVRQTHKQICVHEELCCTLLNR